MDEYGRDGRLGLLAFAGGGMAFAISLVNVIGLMIGKQPPAGLYDLALLLFRCLSSQPDSA